VVLRAGDGLIVPARARATTAPTPIKSHALDFAFEHNGKTYYLPPLKAIKVAVTRKVRHLDPIDAMFTIIETVSSSATLAAIDDMTMDELGEVSAAWQKHSGVSLGE
jgi:hypothetical protein